MGPRSLRSAAALAALLASVTLVAPATSAGDQPRSARILVGFESGVGLAAQRAALRAVGAAPVARLQGIRSFVASVPAAQRGRALLDLRRDPRVRYAEAEAVYHVDSVSNDPSFGLLWGLDNAGQTVNGASGSPDADIDAPEAWSTTTGSSSVVVAVIDTGVDYGHPDLAANIWTNPGEACSGCENDGIDNDANGYVDDVHGWDFVNDDNDPADDHGHGTHVAGTVGAVGDNGLGVVGVDWNVRIMPLKFIGADGTGTTEDAVRAILYAASMGASVSNNSWGGEDFSQALEDAIAVADDRGSLFVAAAGNSFKDNDATPDYPSGSAVPNVVSVAATDQNDARAWFSNYGRRSVDVGAPGTSIYSTWPGGSYAYLDGTSMATPHVVGVAALAKAADPEASAIGLKALLLRTVDPIASLAGKTATGGRVNARTAVTCGSGAQVWLDAPGAGFDVDVGAPLTVTLLGAACGDPAAATVRLTANGASVPLTPRGDGLYVGAYTPSSPGSVTLVSTATATGGTDTQSVTGTATQVYPIVPGGSPVTMTTSTAGENARLVFDGDAGRRISIKLSGVTIGTSCCSSAKVSVLKPDGTTLVTATNFGTSGAFIDTKTLPQTGSYRIVLDPQSSAVGSATVTLYDVPPDAQQTIVPGGAAASVQTTVPGQNAVVRFDGVAGRRISMKLSGVTIGTSCCSSAKVSVLKPDGTTLVTATNFGTSGAFIDTKTLPQTGSYRIVLDPQSSAVGSATVTLYDVPPDLTGTIVRGGASVRLVFDVPGRNASLSFDGTAGVTATLRLTNVTIGTSCCSSAKVSVLKPNRTTLLSPTGFGTNGKTVTLALPVTGTYSIVVDPTSSAIGGVTLTLT